MYEVIRTKSYVQSPMYKIIHTKSYVLYIRSHTYEVICTKSYVRSHTIIAFYSCIAGKGTQQLMPTLRRGGGPCIVMG